MKVRNGFVSNSSSSSFIIIGRNPDLSNTSKRFIELLKKDEVFGCYDLILPTYVANEDREFGRFYKKFSRLEDRLNFVAINCIKLIFEQGFEGKDTSKVYDVLRGALKRFSSEYLDRHYISLNFDYNSVSWDSPSEGEKYTIDHQSLYPDNDEIWESVDSMYDFFFREDSKIYMGSDELEETEEYIEGLKEKYRDDPLRLEYLEKYNDFFWNWDSFVKQKNKKFKKF